MRLTNNTHKPYTAVAWAADPGRDWLCQQNGWNSSGDRVLVVERHVADLGARGVRATAPIRYGPSVIKFHGLELPRLYFTTSVTPTCETVPPISTVTGTAL